jgi:hypothetical protein
MSVRLKFTSKSAATKINLPPSQQARVTVREQNEKPRTQKQGILPFPLFAGVGVVAVVKTTFNYGEL